ncbi:hypothetical protein MLD38_005988 [Melastoma candidum]|uniref:Uncharacterized protein n=1 Tax=Melastoma candidum TaxID=119954 RepID=A0ACB9RPI0_9MYRT|nr:hypothetical protein MLD38_005988 [Melastoma candidum]
MAPRKRKADEGQAGGNDDVPAAVVEKRVTRGSLKRANVAAESEPAKVEVKGKRKGGKKKKEEKEEKEKEIEAVENGEEKVEEGVNGGEGPGKGKTVVIEHCKQCNSFKTRAIQVKNGLENGIPGIAVVINPEKPRRGCFEIRYEGGEKFISLLDMKRPFGPMKALDMEKVIADIVDKIKA